MESIIEVNNLMKSFEQKKVVDQINFQVKKGELFGFLGINGAGKSTTINMLCTLYRKTSGNAKVCGLEIGKADKEIRKKIGVVFQENTLDEKLTIKENLFSRAYLYENNKTKITKSIEKISEILEIKPLYPIRFSKLSGGQKRRCEIARALIHRPEILFLDEPTTGLDPKTRELVWECIFYLKEKLEMTIFLTTHYMEEAAKADHIVFIHQGKIAADQTPFQLKEKFTCDKLKVEAKDQDSLFPFLCSHQFQHEKGSNSFTIFLPDTLSALPLLGKIKDHICAFEVLQGTMEDAFLTITNQLEKEKLK